MKDRVHHLLQLDASPTIEPAEATIAAIDRETDKQETILAYMESELTPQTNQVLQLRFRQKAEISGDSYRVGHQRSGGVQAFGARHQEIKTKV